MTTLMTATLTRATCRPHVLMAAGLLALLAMTPADAQTAQNWHEPTYNPPVGSHWILQSNTHTVEIRAKDVRSESDLSVRSELTIDGKTADGFRVTLVNREMAVTGESRKAAILQPMLDMLKGVVMHGRTDARGMPVAVDNIEEVRARMRSGVDGMLAKFADKPAIAKVMRELMTRMLDLDGKKAATTYLDNLPLLAAGQNTGLKLGEVRTTIENVKSSIGNMDIKSKLTLRIVHVDAKSGAVQLMRGRKIDPESVKAFAMTIVQRLGAAADKPIPPKMLEIMKSIDMTMDDVAEIDVQGGMTRAIHERSTLTASALGHTTSKTETRTLLMMPAP